MKEEQSKVFKVLRRNSTNTLKPKDKYFVYQELQRLASGKSAKLLREKETGILQRPAAPQ